MGDESKLPVWAQKELTSLRTKINGLKQSLCLAGRRLMEVTGNIESPIKFGYGSLCQEEQLIGIPSDSRIRFRLGKRHMQYIDCSLKEIDGDTILEVHAGESIIVRPRVSNVIQVELSY